MRYYGTAQLDGVHRATYFVDMKNITLAVDEDVLADVRRYAAANNTTVNALVRGALESLAERARRQQSEWDDLFRLADEAGAGIDLTSWTRDDLHDREALRLGSTISTSGDR